MENDNQFFITREETEAWLKSMNIKNYIINDDLTVDIEGSVYLFNMNLDYIPVQFKKVTGYFDCSKNKLTSLKGSPKIVGEDYCCYDNPISNFSHLNFEVKGDIIFTPTEDIDYLDNYKETDDNIRINFEEFKKLQALQKLNEKLNDDLSVKDVKIKHKI